MNSHVVMEPPFVIINIIIILQSTCLNEIKRKFDGKTFPYLNSYGWLRLLFRARHMSENTVKFELFMLLNYFRRSRLPCGKGN